MELIRGLHNLNTRHFGCVLTIGKFDGVHLGHKAVLTRLVDKAKELQLPSAVMVFEPQPEELFSPSRAPARLSLLRDKYLALEKFGIDRLICVRFSREFANISPDEFVHDLIVEKLGTRFLVVGDDFRFGKDRKGDFDFLYSSGRHHDFHVVSTDSFTLGANRISSTAIREALANGQMQSVFNMLGRNFAIEGKVIGGEQKGRTIGFPTANVALKRYISPVRGVFTAKVWHHTRVYDSVVNVGTRPTLGGTRMQLEAHLLDFSGDLYGQRLKIELLHKIRHEIKFNNFNELKEQIEKDVQQAKRLLELSN